jgi:hypothetical protein
MAPILPWGAADDVPRISPVEASAAYLKHLVAVFDRDVAGGTPAWALANQDVLLTVPASFDEEARELTLRAAQAAGLSRVTLLEEPQAAVYAWLDAQGEHWRRRIRVGDLILVCDVGGGTTDFSLIAVSETGGDLVLERVAVGDHILLGGDNMDLALARVLQQRLESAGPKLDLRQLHGLWHQCRTAKEALLSDPSMTERPITVLGRGTRLVGGTTTVPLSADDVRQVLLDGFFPAVDRDERPARSRRVGLQELGLPYAADTAITRHLARFLARQGGSAGATAVRRGTSGLICPTHVLFNGGVMKAALLQERILSVLNSWIVQEGFEPLGPPGSSMRPISITPSRAVPPTTAWPVAAAASASAVARHARTMSASRRPCRPCRDCPPPSRPSASSRSAWRKAPGPPFRSGPSAWWSVNRPSSGSSAPRSGHTIRQVP